MQSETKFSLRQNLVRDKIQSEATSSPRKRSFLLEKRIVRKKMSWTLSQISNALFLSCLRQIDAYHH